MRYLSITLIVCLLAVSTSSQAKEDEEAPLQYGPAIVMGVLNDKGLTELSGVVAGGINQNILWVHNDQSNPPYLIALNAKAEKVAVYELDRKNARGQMDGDWEDIARVPGAEKGTYDLYIADTGNGKLVQQESRILVVREPVVVAQSSPIKVMKLAHQTIRFNYADGYLCDSECLMVHPVTKEIYIIAKSMKKAAGKELCHLVWKLPAITDYSQVYTAQLLMESVPAIAQFGGNPKKNCITGGDISADGKHLILRIYDRVGFLWKISEGQSIKEVLLSKPSEITLSSERGGGESICFSFDKSQIFTVYDGAKTGRPVHTYCKTAGTFVTRRLNNTNK